MGFLQNTWVRYYDRSYQQIKDQVITNLQIRVPEITDHTESNIFIKMISIWAAIAEMLGYYTDNAAREAHLESARLYSSGTLHARKADYRVRGKLAANGEVTFTLSVPQATNLALNAGIVVRDTETGAEFTTVTNGVILAGQTRVTVIARQVRPATGVALTSGTGEPNQEIIIGEDVADNSVALTVGGVLWTRVESLGFSLPTDMHYVNTVNRDMQNVAIFGDGINGLVPAAGISIVASYDMTLGLIGNVEAGAIDTLVTDINVNGAITVTNPTKMVSGLDVESLDSLKRRVPISNRTLDRAVTEDDYKDVTELAPGVSKAGFIFECGKTVDLFIVPEGGGIANQYLLDSTAEFMRTRKMLTTELNFYSAGEVRVKLNISINILPSYNNTDVENRVKAALTEFISYKHQEVKGELQLSDIYQIVENTEGVRNSNIKTMTTIPYARPLTEEVPQLNWTRTVKPASVRSSLFKITFITASTFQVVQDNGYLGEFKVGDLVSLDVLDFKININYPVGSSWEFYTYPYFGTIVLQDPSIPVAYAEDITLTVTGGL